MIEPLNDFRIVVIGASAGGYKAVAQLLGGIPENINAALVVVIHSGFDAGGDFAKYLAKTIDLPVSIAVDNHPLESGSVYLSSQDKHLYVQHNKLVLSKGPRENLFRPSIDVLFRSAAIDFANRCIGVLLTGRLNDGTAGLIAIKKCGGITVIQDPATSEFPEMPLTAKREVDIDFELKIEEVAQKIIELTEKTLPPAKDIPESIRREAGIALKIKSQIRLEDSLGEQVPMSCSSCGGPLWKMDEKGIVRYRCHVGHSFSQEALLQSQDEKLEETLWVSLRTFEEKNLLLKRMVTDYESKGYDSLVKTYRNKIIEVTEHINRLRALMQIND